MAGGRHAGTKLTRSYFFSGGFTMTLQNSFRRSLKHRRSTQGQSRSAHDLTRRFSFKPKLEFLEDRLTPQALSLMVNPATAIYGTVVPLTITATGVNSGASPTSGNNGDTIQIVNGTSPGGTPIATTPATLNLSVTGTSGSVTGSPTTSAMLARGSYTLYAHDSSNPPTSVNFPVTDSSPSQPLLITPASTTTSVTPASPTPTYGDTPTFLATVTNHDTTGQAPTGTVQFDVVNSGGTTPIGGPATLNVTGTNTATVSSGPVTTLTVAGSPYTITASYSPPGSTTTANFQPSSGSTSPFTVAAASTTVSVAAPSPSVTYGQSPKITATVSDTQGVQPTGMVQFQETSSGPSVNLGTFPLSGAGASSATASTSGVTSLTVNGSPYTITATYSNTDGNFTPGTPASTSFSVSAASTTVSVAAPSPSVTYGQSPKITATVTDTTGVPPTGSVQFQETSSSGSTNLGTFPLAGAGASSATASTNAVTSLTVNGSPYTITATYSNTDGNFTPGTPASTSFSVAAAHTSVSVAPLSPSVTFGQTPMFTATVTNTSITGAADGYGAVRCG